MEEAEVEEIPPLLSGVDRRVRLSEIATEECAVRSATRRNRSAGSTAFHGPGGRSYLAEGARRGNHDLTTGRASGERRLK
jgi:hypothetical protein